MAILAVLIPVIIGLSVYILMRVQHKKDMDEIHNRWRSFDEFDGK